MKLEDKVISLELARQLKELGVKQKSLFVWEYVDEQCYGVKFRPFAAVEPSFEPHNIKLYSAFTSSELGELLPVMCKSYKLLPSKWQCDYGMEVSSQAENETQARGQMLVWLIENAFVNLEK